MIHVIYTKYHLENGEHKYQKEHHIGLSLLSYLLQTYCCLPICTSFLEKIIRKDKYGKPYLPDYENIHFNISHCDDYVACAISNCPIGIDIERVGYISYAMVKKILTINEQSYLNNFIDDYDYKYHFYQLWTLKESYLKCIGKGFLKNPKDVEFEYVSNSYRCKDTRIRVDQKEITDDCILSICYESQEDICYESY